MGVGLEVFAERDIGYSELAFVFNWFSCMYYLLIMFLRVDFGPKSALIS
jgi:hypothetical protein